MNTVEQNINTVLSGNEIEPNGVYDTAMRKAYNADIPKFRGLPGQITVNPDDSYRPSVWQGTDLGVKEDVVFKTDLENGSLDTTFKSLGLQMLKVDVSGSEYTLDPEASNYFLLDITTVGALKITVGTPNTHDAKFISVYLHTLSNTTDITLDSTNIKWLHGEPEILKKVGRIYLLNLVFDGVSWLAYYIDESNSVKKLATIKEAIVSNAQMLGWMLPAGSTTGDITDEYAITHGSLDISDDDLNNMARVASHIYDVVDVSHALASINAIEDHVENIKTVADNAENINAIAPHVYTLSWMRLNLSLLQKLVENQSTLSVVTDNIASINTVGENFDKVSKVANAITKIETIASNIDNINNVNTNIASVNTVSKNMTSVISAANNIDDIVGVNENKANINTVAINRDSINTVSSNSLNINTLSDNINGIKTVASNISQVSETSDLLTKGLALKVAFVKEAPTQYEAPNVNSIFAAPASMNTLVK